MLSVIAGNVFHPISVGRNTWRKLFGDKGLLEPHCNTEGFNPVCFPILVRIGILLMISHHVHSVEVGSHLEQALLAASYLHHQRPPPTILHATGYIVVK